MATSIDWRELLNSRPQVQTKRALLIIDMQNDFLSPGGAFPMQFSDTFVSRLGQLVQAFRRIDGRIFWVRTELEPKLDSTPQRRRSSAIPLDPIVSGANMTLASQLSDRIEPTPLQASKVLPPPTVVALNAFPPKSKQHSDFFFKKSPSVFKARSLLDRISGRNRKLPVSSEGRSVQVEPSPVSASPLDNTSPEDGGGVDLNLEDVCKDKPICIRGTWGARIADCIYDLYDPKLDVNIIKQRDSAFLDTDLLHELRTQMVSELFVCGCGPNTTISDTVVSAAQNGFMVTMVEDCIAYTSESRHNRDIHYLSDSVGAQICRSSDVIASVQKVHSQTDQSTSNEKASYGTETPSEGLEEVTATLEMLSVNGPGIEAQSDVESDDQGSQVDELTDRDISFASARDGSRRRRILEDSDGRTRGPLTNEREDARDWTDAEDTRTQRQDRLEHQDLGQHRPEFQELRQSQLGQPEFEQRQTVQPQLEQPQIGQHQPRQLQLAHSPVDDQDNNAMSSTILSQSEQTLDSTTAVEPNTDQPKKAKQKKKKKKSKPVNLSNLPGLGPDDTIGEGDSRIIYNFLPTTPEFGSTLGPIPKKIFELIRHEVKWQTMHHLEGEVPRLVAVQGIIDREDKSCPVYRHPSDTSLACSMLTRYVSTSLFQAEKLVGHPLNHALIQLYRSGEDNISEHSDKTLDIVHGSHIVNVSYGAQRTMRLRTKRFKADEVTDTTAEDLDEDPLAQQQQSRTTQRIAMPHNSMFVLGAETNGKWLHGIQPDKRRAEERSPAELAYGGERISLTFRHIGTFLSADEKLIWGQGAKGKTRAEARSVVNGDEVESKKLIGAFGRENREGPGGWKEWYGEGSDVLHFRMEKSEGGESEGVSAPSLSRA